MGRWWHNQWLRAQGVSELRILEGTWKNPFMFEVYPPHCVICDRPWRPDQPQYIAVFGRTRKAQILTGHFTEWYWKGIAATTGLAPDQDQIRHLCTEHEDIWVSVPDCYTGEQVEMRPPLTWGQRAWADVRYWSSCALRFVYLLVQPLWDRDPLTRHVPWPPLGVG